MIINGIEIVNELRCPWVVKRRDQISTRGNGIKFIRQEFKSKLKKDFCHQVYLRLNFITNRVVPLWNTLPDHVIKAPNLNSFKARLDVLNSR